MPTLTAWTTFESCLPRAKQMIVVEGYGLGQFQKRVASGEVDVRLDARRTFRFEPGVRWRSAERQSAAPNNPATNNDRQED